MSPKLPGLDFLKILERFGEKAARETQEDVERGRISVETLQKYLYRDGESREEFAERVRRE